MFSDNVFPELCGIVNQAMTKQIATANGCAMTQNFGFQCAGNCNVVKQVGNLIDNSWRFLLWHWRSVIWLATCSERPGSQNCTSATEVRASLAVLELVGNLSSEARLGALEIWIGIVPQRCMHDDRVIFLRNVGFPSCPAILLSAAQHTTCPPVLSHRQLFNQHID